MLDGWYCRSIANNEEVEDEDEEEEDEDGEEEETVNYKAQYRSLKRKLKFLIYENECFQETLRNTQRRLLKASRDRCFLLDRLLQYEKVDVSSSESEETESSDDGESSRLEPAKKRKIEINASNHSFVLQNSGVPQKNSSAKKKKPPSRASKHHNAPQMQVLGTLPVSLLSDGHMTPEEVERHLESRQTYLELVPEKAPPTVPNEMFSNDPSLDSESNELGEMETSPSNVGEDCLSVDMIPE